MKPTRRPPKMPEGVGSLVERVTDPDSFAGVTVTTKKPRRDNTMVFEGARIGKKFRLLEQLGDGGMGKVWVAQHLGLRRTVALKVLHKSVHAQEDLRRRFEREAVAIGALSHPGIVEALDFGELEDGRNFLAMELVRGRTLADLVGELGPLAWRDVVRIGVELADAIAFAHAHGVLHRDLKPDNLMIEGGDPHAGRVRVLDLGLARIDGQPGFSLISDQNMAFGTANYSAPEQLRGGPTDARSDVYGIAAVMYFALGGRSPYPGSRLADVVMSQHQRTLLPLETVAPDASRPRALDQLLMRCLAHDPNARCASAVELLGALRALPMGPRGPHPALRRILWGAGLVLFGALAGVAGAMALGS